MAQERSRQPLEARDEAADAPPGEPAPPPRPDGRWRAWAGDIALGVGAAILVAVSPFTPDEWGPSLAAGALLGVGVVGWRIHRRRGRPRVPEIAKPAARLSAPASAWIALALVVAVFAPTGVVLYESWTRSIWQNAHGILIPPVMFYMIYRTLRRDTFAGEESSAWGFALLVPALGLAALEGGVQLRQLSAIGLVLALPGLALLLLGARRTRLIAVPLLLGVFMIPIPETVAGHLFLKQFTAALVERVVGLLGLPIFREGTLLFLSNATFTVADACSGFSSLYAAVGISIILAALTPSWPRRLLLLGAAWPLALACNVLRVSFLVVVANHYGTDLLDTPLHEASGVAAFWLVLVLLFLIADRARLREAYA